MIRNLKANKLTYIDTKVSNNYISENNIAKKKFKNIYKFLNFFNYTSNNKSYNLQSYKSEYYLKHDSLEYDYLKKMFEHKKNKKIT
jgi:hypothetical protein